MISHEEDTLHIRLTRLVLMFVPRQLPPAGPLVVIAKADVDSSEVGFVIGRLGLGV